MVFTRAVCLSSAVQTDCISIRCKNTSRSASQLLVEELLSKEKQVKLKTESWPRSRASTSTKLSVVVTFKGKNHGLYA